MQEEENFDITIENCRNDISLPKELFSGTVNLYSGQHNLKRSHSRSINRDRPGPIDNR